MTAKSNQVLWGGFSNVIPFCYKEGEKGNGTVGWFRLLTLAIPDIEFNNMRCFFRILIFSLIPAVILHAGESHLLAGEVVEMDPEVRKLTLKHSGISGVLEAGETVFRVGAADIMVDYTGNQVRGTAYRIGEGWWMKTIWPSEPVPLRIMADVNRIFQEETATGGRRVVRMQGDFIPNFALFNQKGEVVQFRDFKGEVVVLNFIFTRCPDPSMCPASTARMARMQRLLDEEGWQGVHQVSITLDPAYDTPGILAQYAESRGISTEDFSFLTGGEAVIDDVLKTFGLLTYTEEGVINHTMATFIIDPNGKILHRRDGSRWSVADFMGRLANYLSSRT